MAISGCFYGLVHFALCVALGIGLSLVVQFLTAAESELEFAAAVLVEVDRERNEGKSLLSL